MHLQPVGKKQIEVMGIDFDSLESYFKKGRDLTENTNITVGEWSQRKFDSIIVIDNFIESLSNSGKEPKELLEILPYLIDVTKEKISNPILENEKHINQYLITKLQSLHDQIIRISKRTESVTPQTNNKLKTEKETPKTFEELFYNTDLVAPCIDILKELDPPLIDTDCNYIGKLKGVFCVWIDEMKRQGIVKHYSDRKIYALLIPQKINCFSIDESMFGKPQPKAEDLYKTDIKTMVSNIKLSQNSQ
jgi:hypothetical protein